MAYFSFLTNARHSSLPCLRERDVRLRDRSFFMRDGGLVGFGGGGHSKKIGLKGGASRKKMKERGGGSDQKIRLKIE